MNKFINKRKLVKISNSIALIALVLLIYWLFTFISIEVFGFKVFKHNLTVSFYFSILGILALMAGSLIINIMLNLTIIAEKTVANEADTSKNSSLLSKILFIVFLLSFPLIFALLYGGDYLTSKKKQELLINSAKSIINANPKLADKLVNYSFNKNWIKETSEILDLFEKTDTYFPDVKLIVADNIDESMVFLSFGTYFIKHDVSLNIEEIAGATNSKTTGNSVKNNSVQKVRKKDYIRKTTNEERDYLYEVFFKNSTKLRFEAKNGNYELFYPFRKNGKTIILYFSDFQRYGKLGS